MSKPEMGRLNGLYPNINNKPNIPFGIDSDARENAKRILQKYYSQPRGHILGNPIEGDTFKNIAPFISGIDVNKTINESEIKDRFAVTNPSDCDKQTILRFSNIIAYAKENSRDESEWKSCNYRPVTAITEKTVTIDNEQFHIGGIGNSGAHELFHAEKENEIILLSEAIFEALLIAGMPIQTMTYADQERLRQRILQESSFRVTYTHSIKGQLSPSNMNNYTPKQKPLNVLQQKMDFQQLGLSLNCNEYTENAISGAKHLAPEFEIDSDKIDTIIQTYNFCPMHKYQQYDSFYTDAGLSLPGKFGRLRCPSHCAETQALERSDIALFISLFTGDRSVYVYQISPRFSGYPRYKPMLDQMEISYIIPNKEQKGGYKQKKLVIDKSLSFALLQNSPEKRNFLHMSNQIKKMNIDVSTYDTIYIRHKWIPKLQYPHQITKWIRRNTERGWHYQAYAAWDNFDFTTGFGRTSNELFIEGSTLQSYLPDQLGVIKYDDIPRIKNHDLTFGKETMWTSAAPCLHCVNVLSGRAMDSVYIDSIPWGTLKGDDGLALEALSQLPIRTVVLK